MTSPRRGSAATASRAASAVASRRVSARVQEPPSASRARSVSARTARPRPRARPANSPRQQPGRGLQGRQGGDRLGEAERDLQGIRRPARAQRPVGPAPGQPPGPQAGTAEAVEDRRPGERGHLAHRDQPQRGEPLQGLALEREPLGREGGEEPGHLARAEHQGPPQRGLPRGLQGGEARRGGAQPAVGAHRQRGPRPAQHPLQAAVQAPEPAGREAGDSGLARLDRRAHVLERAEHPLARLGRRVGVGHHQLQIRAAGQRLAHPQARADPLGLGRRGAEPDHLSRPGLGAERDRQVGLPPGPAQGDHEREPGDEGGDDHEGNAVLPRLAWIQGGG